MHLALNYTLLSTRPCSLNSKHTTLAATFNLAGLFQEHTVASWLQKQQTEYTEIYIAAVSQFVSQDKSFQNIIKHNRKR